MMTIENMKMTTTCQSMYVVIMIVDSVIVISNISSSIKFILRRGCVYNSDNDKTKIILLIT